MKIDDTTVRLSAQHDLHASRTLEITTESDFRQVFAGVGKSAPEAPAQERERVARILQSLVDAIMAAMDGKKCPENLAAAAGSPAPASLPVGAGALASGGREVHWRSRSSETVCEAERTTVCGSGRVNTADGRRIDFNFSVDMAREFRSQAVSEQAGTVVLRDPLVLGFDGKGAELSERRIAFDLDSDGRPEEIPGLGASSGFLVFDRNGNGKADNGSELFGAASGQGFADLATLDSDHNGWIDESDPAFGQLAVWSGDRFDSLAGRGVGALCTAAVDAPFALKTGANQLLGQIRAAGLYLSEAGEVGQLQQVDLAVSALPGGAQQPAEGEQLAA